MSAVFLLWWSVCWRMWAVTSVAIAVFVAVVLLVEPVDGGLVWWRAALVGGVMFGGWFALGLATACVAVMGVGWLSRWWLLPAGAVVGVVADWPGSLLGVLFAAVLVLVPALRPGLGGVSVPGG